MFSSKYPRQGNLSALPQCFDFILAQNYLTITEKTVIWWTLKIKLYILTCKNIPRTIGHKLGNQHWLQNVFSKHLIVFDGLLIYRISRKLCIKSWLYIWLYIWIYIYIWYIYEVLKNKKGLFQSFSFTWSVSLKTKPRTSTNSVETNIYKKWY